jgi:hypothetical protein
VARGREIGTFRREISKDGKQMTVTFQSSTLRIDNVEVLEKVLKTSRSAVRLSHDGTAQGFWMPKLERSNVRDAKLQSSRAHARVAMSAVPANG